jgi:hypothetical protein
MQRRDEVERAEIRGGVERLLGRLSDRVMREPAERA